MSGPIALNLTGWTRVHTWHESHGEYSTDIYQRAQQHPAAWRGRVELLEVSTYRDGRPTSVRTADDKDYLLARAIRANPGRYQPLGARSISACCTAGTDDFHDVEADRLYRIFGAAGHGEWAFEIQPEDVGSNPHA